jgi:predicted DNA binding CopG/RHH family protein
MPRTEADKKAQRKYQATLKGFHIKLKPEVLEKYQQAAARKGMTFRSFVLSSMEKAMIE